MKYTITFIVALLLLGCTAEQKSASTTTEVTAKKTAPVEKVEVIKVEKAIIEEKVAQTNTAEAKATPAEVVATVAVSSFNAEGTFKRKCAGCHGATGEKAALGKSQIIKGWEATRSIEALIGYKDGSYGGAMKGLMASQVSSLNESELKALAQYIAAQ